MCVFYLFSSPIPEKSESLYSFLNTGMYNLVDFYRLSAPKVTRKTKTRVQFLETVDTRACEKLKKMNSKIEEISETFCWKF